MSDHDQDEQEPVEETNPPTEATEQRQPAPAKPVEAAKVPAAEPAKPEAEKPEGTQPKPIDLSVDARLLRVELREGLGLKSLEQADKVASVIRDNPSLSHQEAFAIAQGRDPVVFGRTDPRGPQQGQGALPPGGPNPRTPQPEQTKVELMREASSKGLYRQRANLAREAIRDTIRKVMADQ